MLPELPERGLAPRQKFRGKKRHFRKMLRKAADFELHDSPWWNLWHYHADWEGWGNLRWSYRREGLGALALVFRRIAQKPPPDPFQLWIRLDGSDAGQDAVYLLSPNPDAGNHTFAKDCAAAGEWEALGQLALARGMHPVKLELRECPGCRDRVLTVTHQQRQMAVRLSESDEPQINRIFKL